MNKAIYQRKLVLNIFLLITVLSCQTSPAPEGEVSAAEAMKMSPIRKALEKIAGSEVVEVVELVGMAPLGVFEMPDGQRQYVFAETKTLESEQATLNNSPTNVPKDRSEGSDSLTADSVDKKKDGEIDVALSLSTSSTSSETRWCIFSLTTDSHGLLKDTNMNGNHCTKFKRAFRRVTENIKNRVPGAKVSTQITAVKSGGLTGVSQGIFFEEDLGLGEGSQ